MSYATIEVAVQTLLVALDQYAAAQVTRGDLRVLDAGYDEICVLRPGRFAARVAGDWGQKAYDWEMTAVLYQRYVGDGSEWTGLETQRQNVVDQLHQYPSLDGTAGVTDVLVRRAGEVSALYPRGSQVPDYLMQALTCVVHEEVLYTSGEFTT